MVDVYTTMSRSILIFMNLFVRFVIPLPSLDCLLWHQRKINPPVFMPCNIRYKRTHLLPRQYLALSPTHTDPRPILGPDLNAVCFSNGNVEWLMALTPPGWAFEFMISTHDAPVFVLE